MSITLKVGDVDGVLNAIARLDQDAALGIALSFRFARLRKKLTAESETAASERIKIIGEHGEPVNKDDPKGEKGLRPGSPGWEAGKAALKTLNEQEITIEDLDPIPWSAIAGRIEEDDQVLLTAIVEGLIPVLHMDEEPGAPTAKEPGNRASRRKAQR